ncbi:MAG: hypothetical protein E6G72_13070 [Alphaproteobacteria bacterium]|nr:MAG: hypothetical protein E6G72_13070 [Alphaproteobacteria bacterium]
MPGVQAPTRGRGHASTRATRTARRPLCGHCFMRSRNGS